MSKSILYVKPIKGQSISGSGTAEAIVDARSISDIAFFVIGTISAGTVEFEAFGSYDGVNFDPNSCSAQTMSATELYRASLSDPTANWPFYKVKFTGSGATATNCEIIVHGLGYGG
jgi:hypothetical protein